MKNTVHKKVVRLNQAPLATQVLERILEKLKVGEITDFVIIANAKVPKEKQEAVGGENIFHKYWFAQDSGIKVIGLLEYMKNEVYDYVAGYFSGEYQDNNDEFED